MHYRINPCLCKFIINHGSQSVCMNHLIADNPQILGAIRLAVCQFNLDLKSLASQWIRLFVMLVRVETENVEHWRVAVVQILNTNP